MSRIHPHLHTVFTYCRDQLCFKKHVSVFCPNLSNIQKQDSRIRLKRNNVCPLKRVTNKETEKLSILLWVCIYVLFFLLFFPSSSNAIFIIIADLSLYERHTTSIEIFWGGSRHVQTKPEESISGKGLSKKIVVAHNQRIGRSSKMTRQTRKLGHGQWKGLLWTLVAIMVATRIREDQIAIPQFLQSSSTVRHAQWTMNANIQNNTTTPTIQYPSSRPLPTQQSLPPSHSINKQPLEKDTHGNCWRYCHHRNHLVYYRYQNFAGLADRMSVLNSLASLAGYLCARFEWSSPSQMLAKRHNHNQPIAESTEWNDFFDARWLQDGTPLWSTNTTTSSITNTGRNDQNHTIYSLQNWTLILECKTRSESLSQLEQIEAFSLQHTDGTSSFLWIIDFNLYDMRGSMVSRLRGKAINQTTMSIPTTTTTIRTANITSTMAHSTNSTFPIADQTNRNNSIPRTTTDQADDNERMLPSLITMPVRWGCTYHELTIPSHS